MVIWIYTSQDAVFEAILHKNLDLQEGIHSKGRRIWKQKRMVWDFWI